MKIQSSKVLRNNKMNRLEPRAITGLRIKHYNSRFGIIH